MKVITRDLWLCSDCTQAAVNDDYTGLDYSLSEKEANARMEVIQRGLASLGPHLVPDFGNDVQRECRECSFVGSYLDFTPKVENEGSDEEEVFEECPSCHSYDTVHRESGELEFSRIECDCCGSDLAGARFRFAQLGEED